MRFETYRVIDHPVLLGKEGKALKLNLSPKPPFGAQLFSECLGLIRFSIFANGAFGTLIKMVALLETQDLKKHYRMGDTVVRALDGVSISVAEGQFVALLGPSGSGKSTLLNLIAGLDRPTAGTLQIDGIDIAAMSQEELSRHRRKNVGIIFQSFNLVSAMSALENVTLSMMFGGVPKAEREQRATQLLESVGLAGRQRHRPKELSGGEQQRVAISRALANKPRLLLADEPTGNLDSRTSHEIMEVLKGLNEREGKAIILVTHDANLAGQYAQRTITLMDGMVQTELPS
jgi:putative ABC transport system ATP-binding protein